MAPHILNQMEQTNFFAISLKHCTSVYRTRLLINRFMSPNLFQKINNRFLMEFRALGQTNLRHIFHQTAKHGALTTARGHHSLACNCLNINGTASRFYGRRVSFPVHLDTLDILGRLH